MAPGSAGSLAPIDSIVAAATCTASSYFSRGTTSRVVIAQPWPAWMQAVNAVAPATDGDVGVVEHDRGGLAAELEEHLLQRRRGGGHDRPAGRRSSR